MYLKLHFLCQPIDEFILALESPVAFTMTYSNKKKQYDWCNNSKWEKPYTEQPQKNVSPTGKL